MKGAIFYEGTEEQLQQINRPTGANDPFRYKDISYNQTIPEIDDSENNGGNTGSDTKFSFKTIISWIVSVVNKIVNFVKQLFA